MLMKLLKYDMRSIGRTMWPVLGALLILSVLIGLNNPYTFFIDVDPGVNVPKMIPFLIILFVATFFASMGMVIYMIVQRFNQNLLGKQGYLMFSLPVSTMTHIFEKILLSLIWSFLWLFGIGLSFCIITLLGMQGISLEEFLRQCMNALARSGWSVKDFVAFFRELLSVSLLITTLTSVIYAAIAVGHLSSSHRFITSVIAFVMLLVIMGTISNAVNLHSGIESTEWGMNVVLMGYTVMHGLLAWFILDRRLNLD